MRINTNAMAVNTGRILADNRTKQAKTTAKLSSGLRLNSAADDAAGVSISAKMRAQIKGMERASRNVQDGVSMVQVGDGALLGVTDMLQRIRELTVQAASDTNAYIDRNAIQLEISQLITEINTQLQSSEFNGIPLFDGSHVGTYEYAHGIKGSPSSTPTDPAYLTAGEAFPPDAASPLVVANGVPAVQMLSASQTFLEELNGTPPTFPKEGVFIITVQIADNPPEKRDAILDFETENADGNFDLDDFRAFYMGTNVSGDDANPVYSGGVFSDWINDGKIGFLVKDDGAITVETMPLYGGSNSSVLIGATDALPPGKRSANSAILGTSRSYNTLDTAHGTSLHVNTKEDLNAYTEAQLWDALNHPVYFSLSVRRSSDYSTVSQSPVSFSTAGCSTLQEFNALIQSSLDHRFYSNASITSLTPSVDREGNVYVYLNSSVTAASAYQSSAFFLSGGVSHPSYNNALQSLASVTSNYTAVLSDRVGTLDVSIIGIPNGSGTKSAKVTVDFETNRAFLDTDNDGMPDFEEAFSNPTEMAKAIQDLLNNPANYPDPLPTIKPNGYNSSYPVATVTIDADNKLSIQCSERTFGYSVTESQSDRPMFVSSKTSMHGDDYGYTINIAGTPNATVKLAAGSYTGIEDFIARNAAAFRPNYVLKADTTGTKLLIESVARGAGANIASISSNPVNLLDNLGLVSNSFQSGVTHPTNPVVANGLWIQGGANSGDGLFLFLPRLDAYDLGLMIKYEDVLNPSGSHRVQGGVNGSNSIAGTGGTGLGSSAYVTEANIQPEPKGFGLDVSTHEKAVSALAIVDNALNIISSERSQLGAMENRLAFTSGNLGVSGENLTSAESRIRDADMAKEMARFAGQNILSQAATAMLAQANSVPQSVLQLLK